MFPAKRKGLRRSEGFSGFRLLGLEKKKHEREQDQRFNESKADKQCGLDTGACTWISCKCFSHGTGDFALSEPGQSGGKAHSQTDADWHRPIARSGCAPLSVHR